MSTANNKPTDESVSLNAFKQPKAFYLIFSIELWERFGYYGLQGIMAVYLVKQLGMSEADSITLFSSFSALVYGLVAIGGWLGDKVLGTKRVIMLGAIVLAIGYGLVAWSGHDAAVVYMGMATIAVGNGLFKANPSSLLSTCYSKDDPRLDGAFTMYYMSINIGSFFSMLATPWLAAKFGWSVAFALSFVGMLITVVNFLFCRNWVKDYGSKPDFEPVHMGKLLATIVGVVILAAIATWLLHNQGIAHLVIDSCQNRAANHNPERVQRLILLRLERDTQDRVLNVTNGEEVQRGWHLAVQYEEDNRFQHQNEGYNHLTTCRTLHREGFFSEDNHDTQRNHGQYGTCNTLVVQQPGRDSGQDHNADDGCQQFAHMHGFEVWFRTIIFNPAATEQEVHNGDQHTHEAQRKRYAPAEFRGQPWGCQHREE